MCVQDADSEHVVRQGKERKQGMTQEPRRAWQFYSANSEPHYSSQIRVTIVKQFEKRRPSHIT